MAKMEISPGSCFSQKEGVTLFSMGDRSDRIRAGLSVSGRGVLTVLSEQILFTPGNNQGRGHRGWVWDV